MEQKKVIVCDLDGTLAESKSTLSDSMSKTIGEMLKTHYFAVISGGDWPQFEKQFLSNFHIEPGRMRNLFLFPTSGAECMRWQDGEWTQVYDRLLTADEKEKVLTGFSQAIKDSGVDVPASSYGDIIEDRGEQITFSGRGQHAPNEVKSVWDPDQKKRRAIVAELQKHISDFEISIGGETSIDVTRKGVNKAYAIYKLEGILGVTKMDIVYIGDALYPGGNDTKAREAGVECIQVSGPAETEKLLQSMIV